MGNTKLMRINRIKVATIFATTLMLSMPVMALQSNVIEAEQPKADIAIVPEPGPTAEEIAQIEAQKQAELAAKAEAERVAAEQAAAQKAQEDAQSVEEAQRAIATTSPTEGSQGSSCGPQDPAVVYQYIREAGVDRAAAIELLGSFKWESGLDPCQQRGDGGVAWGLNSWHPARRYDMPMGLKEQVDWAINVEMKRDCFECYAQMKTPGLPANGAQAAIQKWTRWGIAGDRWQYAAEFRSMF